MVAERGQWSALAWAAAAGALAGVALPGGPLPGFLAMPALWCALGLLWGALQTAWPRRLAALWGGLAVLVSHRWLLALHPLDWIGVPLPLSLPLCLLLLLSCAGAAAALLALWAALAQLLRSRLQHWPAALLLACLWGLAEVLLARGPLFWIGLGGSALPADPALAGLAAWGGAGLVAAVQLLIGWSLWRWLALWRGGRAPAQRLALPLLLLLVLSHGLGGLLRSQPEPPAPLGAPLQEQVLVVQPAIPTREKFRAVSRRRLERQLLAAFGEARARGADLLVMPEGALGLEPVLPEPAPVELLSGGFRWISQGEEALQQRSAVLRFAPGQERYGAALDKHRLVPLGESVPLAGWVRWSGLSAVGGLEPGPSSRLLERPAGAVGVAICYEIADGAALARAARDGAGWLLASANLDPYPLLLQRQFTSLAQLRAIETGRWLVSVANTGPSLLIDPAGRVQQQVPSGRAALGFFVVQARQSPSAYARAGELPLWIALACCLAWVQSLGWRAGPG
jgi:apolipoprotein N-acyltransferase